VATPRIGSTGVVEVKGDLPGFDGADLLRVAVGVDGTVLTADSTAPSGLSYQTASDKAMIFMGGASMGSGDVGKHFGAQDTSNGGKNAVLSTDNQMSAGIAGSITLLTWNSTTADATTVFKINKNGLVVATITLTGVKGAIAVVGLSVALADLIAVEFDAGTAPGRTTTQVWANR
jgi:hypothetical protein